jgi:hypothetical protein
LFSLATASAQSGRVPPKKADEKPAAETATPLDSAQPVLVNMTPEEFKQCGLDKLSPEERQHLDRWFLSLLVKLQSLPERKTLTFEKSKQDDTQTREREFQRQQLETQVRDLQQRLLIIRQQADRMTFDLNSARLAASRGDWSGVQNSLMGMESAITQIKQATQ